tara:strand:+ start:260 stop:430 length:171 start_codon:yes stop_codon:yes gene_type:complete
LLEQPLHPISVIAYIQVFEGQQAERSLNGDNFGGLICLTYWDKGPFGFTLIVIIFL